MMATLEVAVRLCRDVEAVAKEHGCHVALTGGCLYKFGPRKDIDLLFYRVRQNPEIDVDALFKALSAVGLVVHTPEQFGRWCVKASWEAYSVDCFFPEARDFRGNDYR